MIARPKFSTTVVIALLAVTALLIAAAVVIGRDTEPRGRTVVTVRLWDQQVAAAYRRSFDEFTRRHPAIEVLVNVVAYASYFDALRADVAGGSADDIFWISNAYFAPYADSRRLVDITNTMGPRAVARWEPSVVDQFTRRGTLWGVPQLTDAGIAL
jgi:multiple sugar transport system substrate-binding protein